MSIPDRAHTYAYLFIETTTVPLEQIQEILRTSPDETTQIGDPIPFGPPGEVVRFTSWTIYAPIRRDEHFGLSGLTSWLESLDEALSERFRQVAKLGVDVGLNVVQKVNADDDLATQSNSTNFELSPKALRWLADAGARLGIDQYLDTGPEEAASPLGNDNGASGAKD